jgi:uncharacterized protein (DUF58 family)
VTSAVAEPFDAAFLASLSRLAFAVRRLRAREGEGGKRADRRGGRVEFAEHRPYVAGDDVRTLDWAAYARTRRLAVKEYEREKELSLLVLVDASASMGLHGKLLTAQRLAYALCYLGLSGGSRVRVGVCADGELRLSAQVAGTARIRELGRRLAAAQAAGSTRLEASLGRVPGARRGSRVVVLVSDLLAEDDGRRALGRRSAAGDEVNVVHLWTEAETDVPPDGVIWLRDAETGATIPAPPDAVQRARLAAAEREGGWRAFAAHHRLRYVPVDARATTEELVLRWLRLGGVVA